MSGLFTERGRPICAVKTASGTLTITSSGKVLKGFLDRSNLTVSDTPAKFSKACPVLWCVAVPEIGAGIVQAWRPARSSKPIDEFLRGMEKSKGVKIKVLKSKPDESVENTPRECHASQSLADVFEYQRSLVTATRAINEANDLSDTLVRMRLPEGMWGIEEVKKVLSGVKADIDVLKKDFEDFEIALEGTDRKISMIVTSMRQGAEGFLEKISSDIIKDFFTIKNTVSKTAQALYPLSILDSTFKKATGYPTTWAFDPTTFYDFQFCYDGLIKSLVRLAKAEISTIEPLFVWRVHSQSTKG